MTTLFAPDDFSLTAVLLGGSNGARVRLHNTVADVPRVIEPVDTTSDARALLMHVLRSKDWKRPRYMAPAVRIASPARRYGTTDVCAPPPNVTISASGAPVVHVRPASRKRYALLCTRATHMQTAFE
jgi:hypothetical protein